MSKAVLISIQPEWCEFIANGEKTVEVRKTKPKLETPFKVYIYCTLPRKSGDIFLVAGKTIQGNGKVIGEFVCKKIDRIGKRGFDNNFDYCYLSLDVFGNDDIEIEITDIKKSCIAKKELNLYGEKTNCLYAWHISGLVIYDKPRELSEFRTFCKSYYDGDKCDDCKYFIDGRGYEYDESDCGCDGLKPIERPPQSWCYVEGVWNDG